VAAVEVDPLVVEGRDHVDAIVVLERAGERLIAVARHLVGGASPRAPRLVASRHQPLALQAGLPHKTVEAIADGRRPDDLAPEERIAYDLSLEILRNRRVSEETYHRAVQAFGEQGVVDLLGLTGYYSFLATVMNAARTGTPDVAVVPLRSFPD